MIEVDVTQGILQEAERRTSEAAKRFGDNGTHRLSSDRQKLTGYLAEVCINHKFPEIKYSDDLNVDFYFNSTSLDAKSQGCNSKPLDYYSATLYEEQKKRHADYYIFNRVKNDFSKVWICGIISKEKFFKIAKLQEAGTKTNNFTYDQARYEIQYKDLSCLKGFVGKPKAEDLSWIL
jgi:hypothetical protein